MAGGNGDAPSPTTMEDRVLAHLREGLTDAEIAVRLGASVTTVRYHLNNLLAKSGATSRDELKRWRPKRAPQRGSRPVPVRMSMRRWAIVAGAVVVLAVAAFLLIPIGGDGEVASAPPALPAPYSRPDAESLRAEGYVAAGPLLAADVEGDIVLGHSPRALFTPVLLAAETDWLNPRGLALARFGLPGIYSSASGLLETEAGEFTIRAEAVGSRSAEPLPVVGMASRPVVRVWAQRPGDAGTYRATFTPDGYAWIHTEPLDPGGVYDYWTGQQLGLDRAEPFGRLDPSLARFSFTGCAEDGCYVSFAAGLPIPAPVAGAVSCAGPTTILLAAQGGTLVLTLAANSRFSPLRPADCAPRQVQAGDEFAPARHYSIRANAVTGVPLSAGIALNGDLYIGELAPTVGCPCRQGS